MGIVDTVAAIPTNANLTLRLKDAETQISDLKQKNSLLEQEKSDIQARLEKSEQERGALEEQIKNKLAESHVAPPRFDPETGTWVDAELNLRYCAKCKASDSLSPMTNCERGWKCPVCNAYAADPKRPEPPFRQPTRTRTWM